MKESKTTQQGILNRAEKKLSTQLSNLNSRLRNKVLKPERRKALELEAIDLKNRLRISLKTRGKDYDEIMKRYSKQNKHFEVCGICIKLGMEQDHNGPHFKNHHSFEGVIQPSVYTSESGAVYINLDSIRNIFLEEGLPLYTLLCDYMNDDEALIVSRQIRDNYYRKIQETYSLQIKEVLD